MVKGKDHKTVVFLRLPAETDKRILERASRIGISKQSYILTLIDKALKLENEKPPEESATGR